MMENLNGKFVGMRVVVMEDSFACYLLIKEYLKILGAFSIRVTTKAELEKTIANEDIDLVLLNSTLPFNNSTLEITRKIKAYKHDLPVIVLSTYSSIDVIEQYYAAGCDDTLTKPFKLEDLVTVMEHNLETVCY